MYECLFLRTKPLNEHLNLSCNHQVIIFGRETKQLYNSKGCKQFKIIYISGKYQPIKVILVVLKIEQSHFKILMKPNTIICVLEQRNGSLSIIHHLYNMKSEITLALEINVTIVFEYLSETIMTAGHLFQYLLQMCLFTII